jgi:hypothetical protein
MPPRETPPAHPVRQPYPLVLRNEGELHVDSFAKQAAAYFRMSRSASSSVASRFIRAISSYSRVICPCPGRARRGSRKISSSNPANATDASPGLATPEPATRSLISQTALNLNSRVNCPLRSHCHTNVTRAAMEGHELVSAKLTRGCIERI